MKNSVLLLLGVFLSLLFTCNICEKPDNRPDCEKNHTGSYTVSDGKYICINVKIYTDKGGWTSARFMQPGESFTFNNIPSGDVELWEEDAYSDWGYWDDYVRECDDTKGNVVDKKSEKLHR